MASIPAILQERIESVIDLVLSLNDSGREFSFSYAGPFKTFRVFEIDASTGDTRCEHEVDIASPYADDHLTRVYVSLDKILMSSHGR